MTITYNDGYETYELSFKITTYDEPRNLAILAMGKNSEGFIEPYGAITVNIVELPKETYACVDINNFPEAIELIEKYKLGYNTSISIPSGYCTYPIYEFDLKELEKYKYNEYNEED